MRPIDELSRQRGAGHPAALLALAIGIAIGSLLSSPPARSAEGSAGHAIGLDDLGAPKRVTTVPVPKETSSKPEAASKSASKGTPSTTQPRYEGDPLYRQCIDRSDGTNTAWDACGGALIQREDERLNAAWSRVYVAGATVHGQDLLNEQRAWIAFKEASCRVYLSGQFGREGQVLSYPVCRAGVIAARTAELLAYEEDTTP